MKRKQQNRESCKGCFYHRALTYSEKDVKCCHYCLIEGKMRGCPADECDKKLVVDKKTARKLMEQYQIEAFMW